MPFSWPVLATTTVIILAIVGIVVTARRYWPRLQYALLSEDQRRRLASYRRLAYANALTSHEGKLRAAAQAKRAAALATWNAVDDHLPTTLQRRWRGCAPACLCAQYRPHTNTTGVFITSWDSWTIEERTGFIADRQANTNTSAAAVLANGDDLAAAWVRGCLSDMWADLAAATKHKARSKGGVVDCLDTILRGKTNEPKRVARSRLEAVAKTWLGPGDSKPSADTRRRFLLELRNWAAVELAYDMVGAFCSDE